ncbi:bacteriohemerythrin [Dechloromonas denitrificans]|uniref:bacteriohemerythrin n=1 Tax=Dechloromonas denitrificans TaxID=281362 RepID=UPI001CFC25FF|nr:hemerythrin family protein [Dechloromonas denitrificans]UCV06516.1 hemerythrin family protein [Dechloromonas denitrificans]
MPGEVTQSTEVVAAQPAVAAAPQEGFSWVKGGELPPELITGHKSIDAEHRMLLSCITSLRKVCIDYANIHDCGNCDQARRGFCENELVAMLGDLFAFILDHFKTEEEIMRHSLFQIIDRDVCEAHMEDHAAISGKVLEIVASLDPMNTVSRIRDLDILLSRWIVHHIGLHDVLLARWVEREGAAPGQANKLPVW